MKMHVAKINDDVAAREQAEAGRSGTGEGVGEGLEGDNPNPNGVSPPSNPPGTTDSYNATYLNSNGMGASNGGGRGGAGGAGGRGSGVRRKRPSGAATVAAAAVGRSSTNKVKPPSKQHPFLQTQAQFAATGQLQPKLAPKPAQKRKSKTSAAPDSIRTTNPADAVSISTTSANGSDGSNAVLGLSTASASMSKLDAILAKVSGGGRGATVLHQTNHD